MVLPQTSAPTTSGEYAAGPVVSLNLAGNTGVYSNGSTTSENFLTGTPTMVSISLNSANRTLSFAQGHHLRNYQRCPDTCLPCCAYSKAVQSNPLSNDIRHRRHKRPCYILLRPMGTCLFVDLGAAFVHMTNINALLQPFFGYVELEMYVEANDELENLPPELKKHPAVLRARLELLIEMKRWEDGTLLGESLCGHWPDQFEFWFKTAYCLHELKRTQEAKDKLLEAPAKIRETALFHYNLACYETQLGNFGEAKQLLKSCFERDKNYRNMSLDDSDLEPLWDRIKKM